MNDDRITWETVAGALLGMLLCALLIMFPLIIGLVVLMDGHVPQGIALLAFGICGTLFLRRVGPTMGC